MARKGNAAKVDISRPVPPVAWMNDESSWPFLIPALEIGEWVSASILAEDGPLHNADHQHLQYGDIAYLWARTGFAKKGRIVLGQAEEVMIRASGWQKARQMQQLHEWFGREPQFIITLDATHCATCSDTEFCALIEHELYHIGQDTDEFGMPKFTKSGSPALALRGHDIEEFVGVVRRYGASGDVARLVEAAKRPAEVATTNISRACGTCLLKAA